MAKRCLIVANEHYEDPSYSDLPGAARDAHALAEVLRDPDIGGFEVEIVYDASAQLFRRSIEIFFRSAQSNDLLIVHLSCHGEKNRANRLVLVAADTEKAYLDSTGVDGTFISDQVESSRSHQVVVLLDCCYSGAYSRGFRTRSAVDEFNVAEAFAGRGRVVITASTALQYSHETTVTSRAEAEPSLFTSAVVEGLSTGDADLDQDGQISVDELYDFVRQRVTARNPNQTPTRSVSNAQGTLFIAANIRASASGLPYAVVNAMRSTARGARIGAVHLLTELLSDLDNQKYEAARDGLALLAADPDGAVADQARSAWLHHGLGDLPRASTSTGLTHVVGIDFGTTNSSVAFVADDGSCRIVPNLFGNSMTPSIAALTPDNQWLVGEVARRQEAANPGRTFRSVKLKLGTTWGWTDGAVTLTAESVAEVILRHLRTSAETYLNGAVRDAVITVPAYFGFAAIQATVQAATAAGLRVLRVINEPTAAALAYGVRAGEKEQTVLVFDLGGGTFDVSLLEIGDGVIEVKAVAGDNRLGGDNWDRQIVGWLVNRFRTRHGVDLSSSEAVLQRLQEAAEQAKIELSSSTSTLISLPYVSRDNRGNPLHLSEVLSRSEFQRLTIDLLERTRRPVQQVVADADIKVGDIDHVVMVGGSTRMPAIADLLADLCKKAPRRGIVPDGVALGAAYQAGILDGRVKDVLLLDVTPLSLGIETSGGFMTRMIVRNTTIPTKYSEIFTTDEHNQPVVHLHLLAGERENAAYNQTLGRFELDVAPAARGVARIEVTLDIDANGILHVSARDLATNKSQSFTVQSTSRSPAVAHPQLLPAAIARHSDPGQEGRDS